MGSSVNTTEVEVFIKESDEGLLLESLESASNCQSHAHKTVILDLSRETEDIIITSATCAAIDLQAIVCLNLSRANIQYVPDAFASLRLKQLNLSHNRLENIPDCLKNGLRCLEHLDLSHNELKSFETVPQCVIKLRVLRINNNKLTNIPQWVLEVNCFNLEELYYSYNEIRSLKSSQFHRVSSYRLKKLEMKNCMLRCDDIKFLKNICTLTSLDISNEGKITKNCFISDSFSHFFVDPLWHDRLTVLRLNDLHLSFIPDEIGKLIILEELYFTKNDLLWLPDSLTSLERLRVLDISHNQIISLPANLKKLETLLASNNSISSIPDFISTNLRVLDLYNNCLDTDCDFIINNINKVDLEQNFFDTINLNDQGYEGKKEALRLGVEENRSNGPKEQLYDKNDSYDDATTDSELEFANQGGVEGELVDRQEESWSPIRELCENGCTSSDNEWTGNETVYAHRKKIKRILGICPEWMLEDD